MPFYDVRCLSCGREQIDVLTGVGEVAACASCGQPTERVWRSKASNVNGDECDFVQENGTRHPIRFRSKREFGRWLREHNYENRVEHKTVPGTDKSPYTTDWSKGCMDPYTLAAGAALVMRNGAYAGNDPAPEPLNVSWQVRDVHPKDGPGPWRDCAAPR